LEQQVVQGDAELDAPGVVAVGPMEREREHAVIVERVQHGVRVDVQGHVSLA